VLPDGSLTITRGRVLLSLPGHYFFTPMSMGFTRWGPRPIFAVKYAGFHFQNNDQLPQGISYRPGSVGIAYYVQDGL